MKMSQFHEYVKIAKEMLFEEETAESEEATENEETEETTEAEETEETAEETETEETQSEVKTISIEKIQKDFEGQTEINAEEFFKKYKSIFMPIVKKLSKKGK